MSALAPVLEGFFTDRLTARQASPHTVIAYRDTYRLLLQFTQTRLRTPPSKLDLADLDATLIGAFLDHLETDRGNAVLTRNLRLAAIHALFHYAALRCPEHANTIARVLAIPSKRPNRGTVTFLTRPESNALLAAIDRASPLGRRDHLLLTVAIHTGLRVSELTGLRRADLTLGAGAHVRCTGKGRKERATPLTRPLAALLNSWLQDRNAAPNDPLFPNRIGGPLNTDSVTDLLDKHVVTATPRCPSLGTRRITPHTLRHTCDEPAASRRRHLLHRALARPLRHESRSGLPPRRPHAQRTSPGPHRPRRASSTPLPAARPAPRLPRRPLTYAGPSQHPTLARVTCPA